MDNVELNVGTRISGDGAKTMTGKHYSVSELREYLKNTEDKFKIEYFVNDFEIPSNYTNEREASEYLENKFDGLYKFILSFNDNSPTGCSGKVQSSKFGPLDTEMFEFLERQYGSVGDVFDYIGYYGLEFVIIEKQL